MSFYSQSPRPPTKSSYTSASQHSLPRSASTRVVSSLNRSKELLSVEEELKELLKNSHFTDKQKHAFWEMLETTFDLFQVPLQNGSQNESLIDSSSLELYSKMQSLVTALSSLIMNEEEELARNDNSILSAKSQNNDSTEFSDGENEESLHSHSHSHLHSHSTSFFQNRSNQFPKSASVSNLRISSNNNSRRSSITQPIPQSRRSSLYFKNSPSISSHLHSPSHYEPQLFSNPNPNSHTNLNTNPIRQSDKYRGLQDHVPLRNSFKALQTPIPRSFSGRSERPKSMYVQRNEMGQTPPLPSYSSPSRSNYDLYGHIQPQSQSQGQHDQFTQEFGSEQSFDISQRPGYGRRDSNLSNVSARSVNRSKRYSMRF